MSKIKVREGMNLLDLLRQVSDEKVYGVRNGSTVIKIDKKEFPKMNLLSSTTDTWVFEHNGSEFSFAEDVSKYFARTIVKMDGKVKKFPYFGRETEVD
jgi:hypothetical protein